MKIRQALKLFGRSKSNLTKFRNIYDYDFVLGGNRILYKAEYTIDSNQYIPIKNVKAERRLKKYLRKNPKVAYIIEDNYTKQSKFSAQLKADKVRNIYLDNIPEIGKTYPMYDDGKIRESRQFFVTITDVIPYNNASQELKDTFKNECLEHWWLHADTTDYFVKGTYELDNKTKEAIFTRTVRGEWFSLTDECWSFLLDVTREYYNSLYDIEKDE